MAIYHCSVKTIGRSGGSSIVNSAAYRSGEELYDERCEKAFFYSGKELDIMHKEIMAPSDAPEWVNDREKLWNAVEAREKRCDSQLAREVEISLPREFSVEQNIALVREYVAREFVALGMIADVCLHYGQKGDSYNPHAHILVTMRDIDESGFGKKNISWNSKELLCKWRESFAELTNKHLSLNGFEITVDHRSLKEQGIDLQPHNVELPNDAKERLTDQKERQLGLIRENGEKLSSNPQIALDAITRSKSTFSDRDIAQYLNSRTADNVQFQEVFDKIKAHKDLVRIAEKGGQDLYTTKEMLDIERGMFRDVRKKAMGSHFGVNDINGNMRSDVSKSSSNSKDYNIDVSINNRSSNDNNTGVGEGRILSYEQWVAVEYICQNKDFRAIVGHAGTGKTYMLAEAREIWEKNGYRVQGAALSGIAAQGLARGAGVTSKTVARWLIDWENGRERLGRGDVFIVDEAGMLGTRDVARIMEEARASGAKIVMLGDPQQLQAIEAGAAFRGIVEREGALQMSDIRRQSLQWMRDATRHFAMGETKRGLDLYEREGKVVSLESRDDAIREMVDRWFSDRRAGREKTGGQDHNHNINQTQAQAQTQTKEETSIMLAYRRSDVRELNERARVLLKDRKELSGGIEVLTSSGKREFSESDLVYFLKNDYALGVRNGTLGKVESINESGDLRVRVEDPSGRKDICFNIKDYDHLDHGYAATVHKAQGVTVDKAYVFASKGFNMHIAYVAMSRHAQEATMFWARDEFKDFSILSSHLSREAKKDNALDYVVAAKEFAFLRGIESSYKEIAFKFNNFIIDVKEKVSASLEGIWKSKRTFAELEERRVLNKGMKHMELVYGCRVSRDLKAGEELLYLGNRNIGNRAFAVMHADNRNMKIIPLDNCQDLRISDTAQVIKNKDGQLVAIPSQDTMWARDINNLSRVYGKEVTKSIECGEMGKYRGEMIRGSARYAVMEQYDKIALIDSRVCAKNLREGDYMKIVKDASSNIGIDKDRDRGRGESKDNFYAIHDTATQTKVEKQKQAEVAKQMEVKKSRSMGMEISM